MALHSNLVFPIKMATRKSPLALTQTSLVKDMLLKYYLDWTIELYPLETMGDKMLNGPLMEVGGKGLFVKELERALLDRKADLAIHSMKDMPAEYPHGLALLVIGEREDPRDAFISDKYECLADLPANAKVGTASLRRQCQLYAIRPDLDIQILRGNINTRLARLMNNDFDAIILAAAGLKRMGFENHINHYFSTEEMIPAPGQGALGIEYRSDDKYLEEKLKVLTNSAVNACLLAERTMAKQLGGNCRAPVGAFCEYKENKLFLRGLVGSPKGDILLSCYEEGELSSPQALGLRAAETLKAQGADAVLKMSLGS
jgi:hydroxymethylbilane synthase